MRVSSAAFAQSVEFGLVGASMHKVGEHAAVDDIEALARIYARVLQAYFKAVPV